jgi:hypothetical protein
MTDEAVWKSKIDKAIIAFHHSGYSIAMGLSKCPICHIRTPAHYVIISVRVVLAVRKGGQCFRAHLR